MINNQRTLPNAANKGYETVIGKDMQINGDVKSSTGMRIDGVVTGNVICEDRILTGVHSVIKGNISGDTVEISGTVHGDVSATFVRFGATAVVDGDIQCQQIQTETGARIDGRIVMKNDEPVIKAYEAPPTKAKGKTEDK